MNPMKKLILLGMLALHSLPLFADSVACKSEEDLWAVSFDLNDDILTDLKIMKMGNLVVSRDKIQGIKTRIFKTEFYEFDLGAPRYLDFEKRMNAKIFEAAFYLKKHPFAAEIGVLCKMSERLP
jgi:hypothetical protein